MWHQRDPCRRGFTRSCGPSDRCAEVNPVSIYTFSLPMNEDSSKLPSMQVARRMCDSCRAEHAARHMLKPFLFRRQIRSQGTTVQAVYIL